MGVYELWLIKLITTEGVVPKLGPHKETNKKVSWGDVIYTGSDLEPGKWDNCSVRSFMFLYFPR